MRILVACSLGGAGHLQPLLPFAAAAKRLGYETLVTGPPTLDDMVKRSGHAFAAGGEPPEAQVLSIRERLATCPPHEASTLANREMFGRLATTTMLPTMEKLFADWQPTFVLREPCEYASAMVATRQSIPHAQVAISLAQVEARSITVAEPVLEEHLQGLPATLRAAPYLTRFPAALDPSPFPRTIRYREGRRPAAAPPDWWTDASPPRVYMSFGTVLGRMSIAAGVLRTAIEAVATLDVRVLLTTGRELDRAELGTPPENVHVEAWINQDDVIRSADVVVCHGGSGTVFGAMAAGVPVVAVPLFADQFENGQRTAAAGAGVTISDGYRDASSPLRAATITAGIEQVLGAPNYRRAAVRIAANMANAPTVEEVLDELLPDDH